MVYDVRSLELIVDTVGMDQRWQQLPIMQGPAGNADSSVVVVMACRNAGKADAAIQQLRGRIPDASVEIGIVDLSDLASVRKFAENFRSNYGQLDVLINNAGILAYSPVLNDQGIELQFATNHLGHFLLTNLLLDMMPDDPASRIVSLSSIADKGASIHFDDLTCGGNGGDAYGQSKLACLIFGEELDRRLKASGSKIKSIPVHPGGSDSGLFDDMNRLQYLVLRALGPFITHDNRAAAQPALQAALNQDAVAGEYLGPTGIFELRGPVGLAKRDASTIDLETAKRLWQLSEELTGAKAIV